MKTVVRWLLVLFFVAAGLNHFRTPEIYYAMMPRWISDPPLVNAISGAAEVLGGLGLLFPWSRRLAGWGLVALLLAVFPANVHVALQGHMEGFSFPSWILWARLPFQPIIMILVGWVSFSEKK